MSTFRIPYPSGACDVSNPTSPNNFHEYVVPTCPVDPQAARVNGMSLDGEGRLRLRGRVLDKAVTPKQALERFFR